MKWIVVKLSGDAARPAYETGDDTITMGTASECPAVANLHQGRETGTVIVLGRLVQGACKRVAGPPEQIEAKSPPSVFVSFELSYAGWRGGK